MTEKNTTEPQSAAEFNLKHRVTGAAVLLFLGALVIPWLLGPPSEAGKDPDAVILDPQTAVSEIERDLLDNNETLVEEPEETVYISKITPLSGQASDDDAPATSEPQDEGKNTAVVDPEEESKDDSKETELAKEKAAAAAKEERERVAEAAAARKAKEKADNDKKAKSDADQQQREKELQVALAAENQPESNKESSVDVGWIVQVGLYLEKKGAEKKLSELQKLGFKSSSTIVDTNRGPNTGTRVWLGPFEKRARAESQNKNLKEQTGKDGFIRVYP